MRALAPAVLCLLPALATAQVAPPISLPISPAATVHISRTGLDAVGDAIKGVVPAEIRATGLSGFFECDEETGDGLTYAAQDIVLRLSADQVEIVPLQNRLEIRLGLTLYSDPADIALNGLCFVELDEVCTLALPPTALNAEIGIQVALQDGQILTNVNGIQVDYGNFGNPVGTGCLLGDALETMGGLGVDLIGSVLDQVLQPQLAELEAQLEELLGGFTTALSFDLPVEFGGGAMNVGLSASQLTIGPQGIVLDFDAQFTAPAWGDCVPTSPAYSQTSHDPPAATGVIPGVEVPYHLSFLLNEDLVNQAIYVAWQGGLLCLKLADLAPIELTTDYLALVEPDLVEEIWPEPEPLDARISAQAPPLARFDPVEGARLNAALDLDVFGPELGRLDRYWGNGLFADAGVGLELDGDQLIIDVDFDLETRLGITVAYNEYLPQAIPEGFAGLIPGLAAQFVDLETLVPSFTIPSFYGITLADLDLRVVGDDNDFLGVYAWIDPTTAESIAIGPIDLAGIGCGDDGGGITVPGCEDGAGCADAGGSGCDSGDGGCGGCGDAGGDSSCGSCDAGARRRLPHPTALLILAPVLWMRRRR